MLPETASDTRMTETSSEGPSRLGEGDALQRAIARSRRKWATAGDPGTAEPPKGTADDKGNRARLGTLLKAVGRRYEHCTLDTFQCQTGEQRHVVEQLRSYVDDWHTHRQQGHGIMAIGGVGGGKDHLLIGAAREIIAAHGDTVRWLSGPQLFSQARVHMGKDETAWLGDFLYSAVLILSDPLPPRGGLTDHQAATVQLIVDERYRHRRATWVSLNVKDSSEADNRMGSSIVDRLAADALIIKCDWPSWRRPLG